jgi:hypothetical protein
VVGILIPIILEGSCISFVHADYRLIDHVAGDSLAGVLAGVDYRSDW